MLNKNQTIKKSPYKYKANSPKKDNHYSQSKKTMDTIAKKQKILNRLKNSPLSALKGTGKLLDKLKSQREAVRENQVSEIVTKQQRIVMELNEENTQLIEENQRLKEQLDSRDRDFLFLAHGNVELKEQNESLKQQLLISQNNCSKNLKGLTQARKKLNELN